MNPKLNQTGFKKGGADEVFSSYSVNLNREFSNKTSISSIIKPDYPLSNLNSWKVGGKASFFCEPKNQEDILLALKWAKENKQPLTFLGQGTNVLISDKGIKGLTIRLSKLTGITSYKKNNRLYIKALAGTFKADIMQVFAKHQLAPALFLCGLPGDVAGGVVMNAGVGQDISPKEFKDIVDNVTVIKFPWDPKQTQSHAPSLKPNTNPFHISIVPKKNIKWSYRLSQGWGPGLIYEVSLSWPLKPLPTLKSRLREMALKRVKSQPLQSLSAGSVFKNPKTGEKAGALIEACGLKGHKIGQAQVSEKHANFILNLGGAKAENIHHLIQLIQKKVKETHDIKLEPEIKYIGEWPSSSGFT